MQIVDSAKEKAILDKMIPYLKTAADVEFYGLFGTRYDKRIVTASKLNKMMKFIYQMLPTGETQKLTVGEVALLAKSIIETGIYVLPSGKNMKYPISREDQRELMAKMEVWAKRRLEMQGEIAAEKPKGRKAKEETEK